MFLGLDYISFLLLLSLLGNLYIACLFLLKIKKRFVYFSFLWLVVTVIFWCGAIFVYRLVPDSSSLFWAQFLYASAGFIPVAFFIFSQYFCHFRPSLALVIFSLFLSFLICLLSFIPDFFIQRVVQPVSGEKILLWGRYYFFYIFYQVVFFALSFGVFITYYMHATGRVKNQLLFILFGSFFSVSVAFVTNLILPSFGFFQLNWLGQVMTLVWVGFVTFAIFKHRFMDVRLAIRWVIAHIIIFFIVSLLFFVLYFFRSFLYGVPVTIFDGFFIFIAALFVVLFYTRLSLFIKGFTNKYLFAGVYNSTDLLFLLTNALQSRKQFDDVLKEIYEILHTAMHVNKIIYILKVKGIASPLVNSVIYNDWAIYAYGAALSVSDFTPIQNQFLVFSKLIAFDELQVLEHNEASELVEWMRVNDCGLIVPLKANNELLGVIILGNKLSGDQFNFEDISVLKTFSLQAAIGIENILLYMHSRDFNERLAQEVTRATQDLEQKNKYLEILRKMDVIIMTTLDSKEISQKIVDTVSTELGYVGAILEVIDYKRSVLVPVAFSRTPVIDQAVRVLPRPFSEYVTPLTDTQSLSVQALQLKTKVVSTSFAEVFHLLPSYVVDMIAQVVPVSGFIVYPILSKEQPLGVLTLGLGKPVHEVSSFESNLLDAFMDEVSIALENAFLYEESRQVNAMLYESNKQLVGLDKMKDEFVSIASHELRTPMTAINGYVWMLLQGKGGPLTDKQRYYLDRVAQSTQRLINLVNDMLSVSRIESGKIQLTFSSFDIVALVQSVYDELQVKADERKLEFSLSSDLPSFMVYADANKTREVVVNLLGNALKFTDKGFVRTRIYGGDDGMVYVSISDSGRGVAKEDMQRLFQKFGRLANEFSVVAETTGTGLGLYICKQYVDAMHGGIDVVSELGKGSTFRFWLPRS